jgi:hypothetical protein
MVPLLETISPGKGTMKKATTVVTPNEKFDNHFRATHERSEYLRRSAFNTTGNSVQALIENRSIPKTWREELDEMRKQHRKLGYRDWQFYHPDVLRRMGVRVKPGRRPRKLAA